MSDTKLVRASTRGWCRAVADDVEGVHLRDLPAFTTLHIRTANSLYRVVIAQGPQVYVQGGAFFADPTSAHVDGASIGDSCLKAGWIGVGFFVQFRAGDQWVVTSRVRAITIGQISDSVVH